LIHKKYGRKLLKFVFNELKGTEAEKLFVDTSSNRFYRKAVKIYLDNGFNLEATLRDYYEKGEDQLIFGHEL
jgi:ribosomal protein S18 acetylase RimI-like enzyme